MGYANNLTGIYIICNDGKAGFNFVYIKGSKLTGQEIEILLSDLLSDQSL